MLYSAHWENDQGIHCVKEFIGFDEIGLFLSTVQRNCIVHDLDEEIVGGCEALDRKKYVDEKFRWLWWFDPRKRFQRKEM